MIYNLEKWRADVNKKLADKTRFLKQVRQEKKFMQETVAYLTAVEETVLILQGISQELQNKAHKKLSALVTRCLDTVFEDPYEFRVVIDTKRKKTEAKLVFFEHDHEINPLEMSGGGVLDVASFALRLTCLLLTCPHPRKVLVLDEPFKFVERPLHNKIRQLMQSLADELQVQFVLVTHLAALQHGTVVEVVK